MSTGVRVSGLWTLDWTMDWTVDWTMDWTDTVLCMQMDFAIVLHVDA